MQRILFAILIVGLCLGTTTGYVLAGPNDCCGSGGGGGGGGGNGGGGAGGG